MRLKFNGIKKPVIGLGMELQLISTTTAHHANLAWEIIAAVDDPRIRIGLFESVIEVDTELHPTVGEAVAELDEVVKKIRAKCEAKRLTLLCSGTHPLTQWASMQLALDASRQPLLERLAWVGKRMAIFGLRIHVGIPDGEKAIAVAGALRVLIPLFTGLSASSPYWNGYDTGLASARARIIENVPNAGIPPKIINWSEFVRYVKTLRAAEAIHDFSEIWWDVRPAYHRGTIRLQACDTPHTLREVSIIASIAYATVLTVLQEYRDGQRLWSQSHWIIRENKWRSSRFGLEAEVITKDDGEVMTLREFIDIILERIRPQAQRVGCEDTMDLVEEIFAYGPGYIRQRMYRRVMGPEEATLAVAKEFEADTLSL